jgi:hypothetical protein
VRSRGVIERATIDMFDYVFAPHMVPKNWNLDYIF